MTGVAQRSGTPAPSPVATNTVRSVEISARGVVQGVGFRPHVHRLALRHRIDGWVRNEAGSVRMLAQGDRYDVADFLDALQGELPPLASLDTLDVRDARPAPVDGFRVLNSDTAPLGRLPVSPDVAMCPACEAELYDPGDRRFRYPFITCTDCGPRFTVIESMPYDRERSTMRAFEQCPECLREYQDPADRRYHSETNACPECGPEPWLERCDGAGAPVIAARAGEAITAAGDLLSGGGILALRGLGGFHLAVDATDAEAVARLRRRKGRDAKPLALMVPDLAAAHRLADVSDAEAALLGSRERPIVVLRVRSDAGVAEGVAPGLDSVGIMVAYTPLHRLVIDAADGRPLVMTSGNLSDEPIATDNEEARRRLGPIADALLLHDRHIVARYDDSLVRVVDGAPVFLRRSRGYAPMPLRLPVPAGDGLLAVGPHLKNTFTLALGADAYVSQHIGDLENLETLEHFRNALDRFEQLFRIQPRRVVRDLHPGYLSTRFAEESGLTELPPVQHHHAHIAAVLGEHGVTGRALGIALDGTGFGDDGRTWGFEVLEADLRGYERLAHLRYAPLPGGDRAARSPWRSLLGYGRVAANDGGLPDWALGALEDVPDVELRLARRQTERGVNAPAASSAGRLFDAVAALLGIRTESSYEGHAAMALEAAAARHVARCGGHRDSAPLPFPVVGSPDGRGPYQLDPAPLLAGLHVAGQRGVPTAELAWRFHETLASTLVELAGRLCAERGLSSVALGGGCFQNGILLSAMTRGLRGRGLTPLAPRMLGPNDGAVSYGQAVVAAARLHA